MAEERLQQQAPRTMQTRRIDRDKKLTAAEFSAQLDDIIGDMKAIDGVKEDPEGKGIKGKRAQTRLFRDKLQDPDLDQRIPTGLLHADADVWITLMDEMADMDRRPTHIRDQDISHRG